MMIKDLREIAAIFLETIANALDPNPQKYDFHWAILQLQLGRKVRRSVWKDTKYISGIPYAKRSKLTINDWKDGDVIVSPYYVTIEDAVALDWLLA